MYNNIGGKIKGLAKAFFIVEAIACVICAFVLIANGVDYHEELAVYGFLMLIFGPIVAWVSSWLLYGFGELIDKACEIADNTRKGDAVKPQAQTGIDDAKKKELDDLLAQGLITEEEYQLILSKK
jgi:hypothetical protein